MMIIHNSNNSTEVVQHDNQKLVMIHLADSKHGGFNFEALAIAIQQLSPEAFTLFIYLTRRGNNRIWALSPAAICSSPETNQLTEQIGETSLSIHKYRKAVKELISKGYLVQHPITTDYVVILKEAYHFYELPQGKTLNKTAKSRKKVSLVEFSGD